ncbi:C3a anaphylatoxin chemotactic receptor-like [Hypanus sabinus]|uniref:C3a anaphylatoxin chemotactic receptor-like n=1 Tax=Hypanus sabinus TaxID=79690 RepID=UPI0028C3E7D9|nr:C3a anaphylatoxin chemotactic receptor-like [Hypanus sabinus]
MSFSEGVTGSTLARNLCSHNSTADGNRMEWGATSVVSIFIFTLTVLLGVPGNSAVIWVTGFKMKSKVHTVCFLNLALADLIYCLTLPFNMVNITMIYSGYKPYFSWKFIGTVTFLNASASIYLLCLISIFRCLAITRPTWFQQHLSLTWARAACVGVWILAFVMYLPAHLIQDWRKESTVLEPFWFIFIFGFPLLIMITSYSLVGFRLQGSRFAKSKKPVRLTIAVVVTFMICWIPNSVCDLVSTFTTPIPPDLSLVAIALASFNSALNPLLYVFAGREFHQVIKRSLLASLHLAFVEQRLDLETQSPTPNLTSNTNV